MARAAEPTGTLQATLDGQSPGKPKRKSYTRETKLKVVESYYARRKNLYQTCKHYGLNTKTVMRWIKDEEKIRQSKKGSKHSEHDRRAMYPDVEERLYSEYRALRKKGLKVKGWWFRTKAKQIFEELHPDETFQFSNTWFTGFKTRSRISQCRGTNTCQKEPADKKEAIRGFHRAIRNEAKSGDSVGQIGKFELKQIANVDQTPLPFTFTGGTTYDDTGATTVWVRGGASGLDKRQCTAQLTLFADGEPRVKPLLIFRGKGKRIAFREKLRYDRRVHVAFQENAWCDEPTMDMWVRQLWRPACNGDMLLVLDVHKAQKTDAILEALDSCKTAPVYVPPGTTSLIQPVDVVFNKPFKARVEKLATEHMQQNLDAYVRGEISASERRILFTKWVGEALETLSADKEMIIRSFKKCGISVAVDGSEDTEINIKGLEDYSVEEDDEELSDEDEDPFADIEEEPMEDSDA